jgi:hypothetical protein
MDKLLLTFTALGVAGVSLWGWGRVVRRLARAGPWSVALTIAVGLAGVLFIGGLLNALNLARRAEIDAVIIVGIALAFTAGWTARKTISFRPTRDDLLAAGPIIIAGCFLATYALPQAAFNLYDDFEKYMVHPVEMLATGAMALNPLDSLGVETLGGQAFLQSFVAAHFPLSYLGAVDGVFCLLLSVTLAGFAIRPGQWAAGALAAELCVLAINPQPVNLSALFSGVCLISTAVLITGLPATTDAKTPSAPVLGLVYAGLLSLKGIFALFIGIHALSLVGIGLGLGRSRLRWMMSVTGWTLVFIAPWIILHAPLYLLPSLPAPQLLPGTPVEPVDLFSPAPLYYGATLLDYTGLALAGLLAAGALVLAARRRWLPASEPLLAAAAAGLAAMLTYCLTVAIIGPMITKHPGGLRYACALLIGVIPVCLRLLEPAVAGRRGARFLPVYVTGFGLLVGFAFLPSAYGRLNRLMRLHTPLAFLTDKNQEERAASEAYLGYCNDVLRGPVRAKLAHVQGLVPSGEKIVAWVMAPFWLDFQRNPIAHVSVAGLGMRWARFPADAHYLLVEHTGYAVRPDDFYRHLLTGNALSDRVIATRAVAFLATLNERMGQSDLIYKDDSYILLRIRSSVNESSPATSDRPAH